MQSKAQIDQILRQKSDAQDVPGVVAMITEVFPIYIDLDNEDRPVQIRIQLATAESNAAMSTVNP